MSLKTFAKLAPEKKERIVSTGIRAFSGSSYADVGTDRITKECGISKGLLFHYFGSKKNYYLYCLDAALQRLTAGTGEPAGSTFHEILFSALESRMEQCLKYPDEMHMVNMASRDASGGIAGEKAELMQRYALLIRKDSAETLAKAVSALKLKDGTDRGKAAEGLHIYIRALLDRYLLRYQETPDLFFEDREKLRRELAEYVDLMLKGICREETV